ncbi:MAG: hypothetical protein OEL57_03735 [Trichlorobacter sp.]|uniref:hypothetical protein n=1 Tax=Trichlorobacter sp. TaxID=2911007 RepID=UPI0025635B40|nr:hypothetical protein [Trichlorobacter sp.]MDK9717002.1 hypothetical protein [Trichlorobacter sp.]
MELLALIEKIPTTFWGVVVGSFFTITGVVITNRSNTKRLKIQLDHDREMKKLERELNLRKEIYLAAAEAISAGLVLVGRIGNFNIEYNKLMESFEEKSPSITKVNVIASDDTIKAFTAFMEELTGGILRLSHQRIKHGVLQQRISFIQTQLDKALEERDRMISLMKEFNLAGSTDKQRWAAIEQNNDFERKRIYELSEEKIELELQLFPAQMGLARECQSEIAILTELLPPLLKCVRNELQLPFDEISFKQVIEGSQRKQKELINQFIDDVTKHLGQLKARGLHTHNQEDSPA